MRAAKLLPLVFILSMALGLLPVSALSSYTPVAGDHFAYHETIDVGNGGGPSYSGYSDHTEVTGGETMNSIYSNGTVAANYSYTTSYTNTSGTYPGGSSGSFTWSSSTLYYVKGTDNQTGYSGPILVWFYIDNSIQNGGRFTLLDTPMTVQSRNYGFLVPSESRYVNTVFAQGSSSYTRHDSYGIFTAQYTWSTYFDPTTGYIVGYVWSEHDSNASGDSFTYTENLSVTSHTYPLATGTPPPNPLIEALIIVGIVIVVFIVLVVAVVLIVRRRRKMRLPKHAYEQQYRPPPPSPMPAPSIDLTPKQAPVQQIVVKEVVKVNCKYCGALIDSTAQSCPFCGAPRT